jgi:hypothetical protein
VDVIISAKQAVLFQGETGSAKSLVIDRGPLGSGAVGALSIEGNFSAGFTQIGGANSSELSANITISSFDGTATASLGNLDIRAGALGGAASMFVDKGSLITQDVTITSTPDSDLFPFGPALLTITKNGSFSGTNLVMNGSVQGFGATFSTASTNSSFSGSVTLNNAADFGTTGNGLVQVGGNFVIASDSTLTIDTSRFGLPGYTTPISVTGNFDVSAASVLLRLQDQTSPTPVIPEGIEFKLVAFGGLIGNSTNIELETDGSQSLALSVRSDGLYVSVVPEPKALVLCLLGLGLIFVACRAQRIQS